MSPDLLDLKASKRPARPDLANLASLTDLLGHVSIIHASAFFHLFSEGKYSLLYSVVAWYNPTELFDLEDQRQIAQRCQALLSTQPGSTIFGSHMGAPESGIYSNIGGANRMMFCHSPQSWEKLWKDLYGETQIKVVVTLEAKGLGDNSLLVAPGPNSGDRRALIWSVTIL